jgi:hypothetical protein
MSVIIICALGVSLILNRLLLKYARSMQDSKSYAKPFDNRFKEV